MTTRIQVGIRLRPFNQNQLRNGYKNTRININQQQKELVVATDDLKNNFRSFKFDHIFDQYSSQQDVYRDCKIDNMIDKALDGYHSTIFAYGQTGAGQTFTMEGYEYEIKDKMPRPKEQQDSRKFGIVPRVIFNLYAKIKERIHHRHHTVYVSFLQIYNQKIFDLLNPASMKQPSGSSEKSEGLPSGGLRLRWNQREQFVVENLFVFECKTPEDILNFYTFGIQNRVVASHKLNMASSRSHTILTIRIDSYDPANPENSCSSKLELVDLAGSERIGQTGTQGKLAKESIDINQSLFVLRQVISTLSDVSRSHSPTKREKGSTLDNFTHIPYRESQLTSLLKQSIGGNCYCLMIACISPADPYIDENLSTLGYASKATYIKNEPVQNDDPRNRIINELQDENAMLKHQLNQANKHIQFLTQLTERLQLQAGGTGGGGIGAFSLNGGAHGHGGNNFGKGQDRIQTNDNDLTAFSQYEQSVDPSIQEQRINSLLNLGNKLQGDGMSNSNIGGGVMLGSPSQQDGVSSQFFQKTGDLNVDYEHFSDRLIQSIMMVRELLQSNKELRDHTDQIKNKCQTYEKELYQLQSENQELRDKLNDPNGGGGTSNNGYPNGFFNRDLDYLTSNSPLPTDSNNSKNLYINEINSSTKRQRLSPTRKNSQLMNTQKFQQENPNFYTNNINNNNSVFPQQPQLPPPPGKVQRSISLNKGPTGSSNRPSAGPNQQNRQKLNSSFNILDDTDYYTSSSTSQQTSANNDLVPTNFGRLTYYHNTMVANNTILNNFNNNPSSIGGMNNNNLNDRIPTYNALNNSESQSNNMHQSSLRDGGSTITPKALMGTMVMNQNQFKKYPNPSNTNPSSLNNTLSVVPGGISYINGTGTGGGNGIGNQRTGRNFSMGQDQSFFERNQYQQPSPTQPVISSRQTNFSITNSQIHNLKKTPSLQSSNV